MDIGYEWMNYILREDEEYNNEMCLKPERVTFLEMIQWYISLMPPMNVASTTYRYCLGNRFIDEAEEGDLITLRGYTSVSMNILKTINVVNWKGNRKTRPWENNLSIPMVMMEIRIPAGARFLIIPSRENEIILPHFCKFQVLSKRKATDFITYIVMELVNDPTQCSRESQ